MLVSIGSPISKLNLLPVGAVGSRGGGTGGLLYRFLFMQHDANWTTGVLWRLLFCLAGMCVRCPKSVHAFEAYNFLLTLNV